MLTTARRDAFLDLLVQNPALGSTIGGDDGVLEMIHTEFDSSGNVTASHREDYNHYRPHSSLGYVTSAEIT